MKKTIKKGLIAILSVLFIAVIASPTHIYAANLNNSVRIVVPEKEGTDPGEYKATTAFDYVIYPSGRKIYLDKNGEVVRNDYIIDEKGDLCYVDENSYIVTQENMAIGSTFPKKGLQGDYILTQSNLTGSHILLNLYMNEALSAAPTGLAYTIGGNTYYFNESLYGLFQKTVQNATARNIKTTIVLLLRGDPYAAGLGAMYVGAGATAPNQFYAFNPDSQAVQAFFEFTASFLADCGKVDHYVLGNEVNMPNAYNYTGTLDVYTNASVYAKTFALFDSCIHMYSPSSKLFISLDNCWTADRYGYGIPGKDYLNVFFLEMQKIAPNVKWNIAYHPYAAVLTQTSSIWKNPELNTQNTLTPYITPANLTVLTDYVKDRIGPDCRIILSEQGYDAHEGETIQAIGLAYCYAQAEDNPMIDAAIFRTYLDEGTEGILDLALVDSSAHPREAYNVYQAMDSDNWYFIKKKYLSMIPESM